MPSKEVKHVGSRWSLGCFTGIYVVDFWWYIPTSPGHERHLGFTGIVQDFRKTMCLAGDSFLVPPTFWSQECPGQDSDLEADLAKTGRFGPGWLEGGAVGPEKNEEPDL